MEHIKPFIIQNGRFFLCATIFYALRLLSNHKILMKKFKIWILMNLCFLRVFTHEPWWFNEINKWINFGLRIIISKLQKCASRKCKLEKCVCLYIQHPYYNDTIRRIQFQMNINSCISFHFVFIVYKFMIYNLIISKSW